MQLLRNCDLSSGQPLGRASAMRYSGCVITDLRKVLLKKWKLMKSSFTWHQISKSHSPSKMAGGVRNTFFLLAALPCCTLAGEVLWSLRRVLKHAARLSFKASLSLKTATLIYSNRLYSVCFCITIRPFASSIPNRRLHRSSVHGFYRILQLVYQLDATRQLTKAANDEINNVNLCYRSYPWIMTDRNTNT